MKFTLNIWRDLGIGGERELEVTCHYFHEKACHTMRNGDPGWPETIEFDVEKVILIDGNDRMDVTGWLAHILNDDVDLQTEVSEINDDPDHD